MYKVSQSTSVSVRIYTQRHKFVIHRMFHNFNQDYKFSNTKYALLRLNEREDVFRWGLNQNGIFKVRTMYNAMTTGSIWSNRLLWKLKLPLKIKIFCGI
jgi:hypothetical protein